jgi:hypothetical protein
VRVDDPDKTRLAAYFAALESRVQRLGDPVFVKYLDLGTHIVRLVNYSKAFTPHIEKQLTYVLKDAAPRPPDATLVAWQEANLDTLAVTLEPACLPLPPLLARVRRLAKAHVPEPDKRLQVFDRGISRWRPLIHVNPSPRDRNIHAWNPESATWYYGVENLEPEEFIKQGHIFVQTFNNILKSPTTALTHGAAVILNGRGVLFCARGQRGKSTLAVQALLDGFGYIADDYLVLGKEEKELYAWPLYSIVTLSPLMYGELYAALRAKFVSNNARKDKYVFNLEEYHSGFVSRCPIHLCMIPQIVSYGEPGVVECNQAGKGRALVQLAHSTVSQMGDKHDIVTIKKLLDFVRDLPFFQINLCRDIKKNLRCFRNFLETGTCGRQQDAAWTLRSRAVGKPFA